MLQPYTIGFLLLKLLIIANAKHIIEHFLESKSYNYLVLFNYDYQDIDLIEILEVSQKYETYLEKWNCSDKVVDTNNALIFLHSPRTYEVTNLFNQKGAQRSLEFNTWLIHSNDETIDYFAGNNLRIGLNANFYIVKQSGSNFQLHQAMGMATTKPQIKVSKTFH